MHGPINIRSSQHFTPLPIGAKMLSLTVPCDSNSNSYSNFFTVIYEYTYTCSSQCRDGGRPKKLKKIGAVVNAACHFGHACDRLVSPELGIGSETVAALYFPRVQYIGSWAYQPCVEQKKVKKCPT